MLIVSWVQSLLRLMLTQKRVMQHVGSEPKTSEKKYIKKIIKQCVASLQFVY